MMPPKTPTFLGVSREFSDYHLAEFVVLPVPFDASSSYGKGADKGPEALITASAQVEFYDIETGTEAYRNGICTVDPVVADRPEEMVRETKLRATKYIQDGKFVLTLGGDHSISEGPILAHAEAYSKLSVLQLDAHADLRDTYEGNIRSHACIMYRISPLVANTVAVGIRSLDRAELARLDPDRTFLAQAIVNSHDWIEGVVNRLNENVYITIDLDVFDPSVLPSTGTPEPGGLDWYTVLTLLRRVAETRNIVGADIVELCPNEYHRASDFTAAKLAYKLLSYKAVNTKRLDQGN